MKAREKATSIWLLRLHHSDCALIPFRWILQVMRSPTAVAGIKHLGYPVHFAVLLGVWKILGEIVILLRGFALVKEWAYARILIDLTGHSVAHVAAGDGAGNCPPF